MSQDLNLLRGEGWGTNVKVLRTSPLGPYRLQFSVSLWMVHARVCLKYQPTGKSPSGRWGLTRERSYELKQFDLFSQSGCHTFLEG